MDPFSQNCAYLRIYRIISISAKVDANDERKESRGDEEEKELLERGAGGKKAKRRRRRRKRERDRERGAGRKSEESPEA